MIEQISYLHNHTDLGSNLRMLDCASKVKQLIDRASDLGAKAICITDHEALCAHIEALKYGKELKEKNENAIRILLGNEIYLVNEIKERDTGSKYCETSYFHFILIAKDEIGHKLLRELSSIAWQNSFYDRNMERVPTLKSDLKRIVLANKGHLIASSACIGSELGRRILLKDTPYREEQIQEIKKYSEEKIKEYLDYCLELFSDDFYLEMQPSKNEEQIIVNKRILELSKEKGIKYIVTCDSHYNTKKDRKVHEIFLNSRDEERELGDFYSTTYNMTADELHEFMDESLGKENVSKAIYTTIEITDKIKDYDLFHNQMVPKATIEDFELLHLFKDSYDKYEYIKKFAYSKDISDKYLLYLIEKGWMEKEYIHNPTKDDLPIMANRINLELKAIWETSERIQDKVAAYYLTALEIINMMWNDSENGGNSLVGPSRGSIASYYTAYLIGLQQINPIKYNIPYWRHLHESRPEMPDVDIDTESSKRGRIIEATKKKYGYGKVLNICTFKTEASKSSILTVARALGIDIDTAQYISNMIPIIRGTTTSLKVMVNGNEEDDIKPNKQFIELCELYDGLLETSMSIEGLVSGRSIHASGVIIYNEPYTEYNCCMKSTNGQLITQWSMDDSTYCGGLKFDFLTVSNFDAMRECMELLLKYGYIKWQGNLRNTYDKYFHPDVIDYETEEMWKLAEELKIINLFQFATPVGSQAIKKIRPRNLLELGVSNAIMRLAGQEGKESPLDTYVKYKNDISLWYECMDKYGLTEDEVKTVEKYLKPVYGIASMQEEVMMLSMEPKISNFSMTNSNKLRKGISKKQRKIQEEAKEMFYQKGRENGTSENLLNYIWCECVTPQLSYSFSLPHVLGYSTVAVIQMNMAYHYPIIYWNTGNLIIDSGSKEDNDVKVGTDYGKMAKAVSSMQRQGIHIALPLINEAEFGFKPDNENNQIIFGLKSINGIGDDQSNLIISNRPYTSMQDFYDKMLTPHTDPITNITTPALIKPAQMMKLIKAGCFLELDNPDRTVTMRNFLKQFKFSPIQSLGKSQLAKLSSYGLVTEEMKYYLSLLNFSEYILDEYFLTEVFIDTTKKMVKAGYHDRYFTLDNKATSFFINNFSEDSVVRVSDLNYIISEKKFKKELEKKIKPLRDWLALDSTLQSYNDAAFEQVMDQYASGSVSAWEMESLCYYYSGHELEKMNDELYNVESFCDMPTNPEPYDSYKRRIKGQEKVFYKYRITRIAGTVINTDKNHSSITLLTKDSVVECKLNKGQYAFYNRAISKQNEKGESETVEKSWLERGSKLLITGIRQEDTFYVRRYNDTIYQHCLYKINEVYDNGEIEIQTERVRA